MKYFVQMRTSSVQKFIVEAIDEKEARKLVKDGKVLSCGDPVGTQKIEHSWPLADQTLETGNIL